SARTSACDLDSARLSGFRLWHTHGKQAVLELGVDRVAVYILRKSDRTLERAGGPFGGVDAQLTILLRLKQRLLRAANRQHVLLEADLDVREIHTGQFGVHLI